MSNGTSPPQARAQGHRPQMQNARPRYALRLAYDGSAFAGWQRQASGYAAQHQLEDALGALYGLPRVVTHGASRTDAGVHALGQCAHFDPPAGSRYYSPQDLLKALNARLPATLRVMEVREVAPDFHSQHSALCKTYSYRLHNAAVLAPLLRDRCWHIIKPLDLEAMRIAAKALVGTHEFAVFGVNSRTVRENTVRTIKQVGFTKQDSDVWFHITGNAFLYRMVRGIVGALVSIGRGRAGADFIVRLLQTGRRDPRQISAPACGLCLMNVEYPGWLCGTRKLSWH